MPSPQAAEPDARSVLPWRAWLAMFLALLLHTGLLLWAYFLPSVAARRKPQVIAMDVVRRAPPESPPAVRPPAPVEEPKPPRPVYRSAASVLRPVERPDSMVPSEAVVLPKEPEGPKEAAPRPGGPVVLLPGTYKSLGGSDPGAGGSGGSTGAKPQNRLLKDERLEEKKEPEFPLVKEKGGGFKYDGSHFTAHIGPDGSVKIDDRGPFGFQKGGTISFDFTDMIMRGKKQDPYGAEKRRFLEATEKLRNDLRRVQKESATTDAGALAALGAELDELWASGRPAAVRRREIFERWCEYADDDSVGAPKALRIIESFVHKHMPAGSALAYTPEELRRFAQSREGRAVFDPYHSAPERESSD